MCLSIVSSLRTGSKKKCWLRLKVLNEECKTNLISHTKSSRLSKTKFNDQTKLYLKQKWLVKLKKGKLRFLKKSLKRKRVGAKIEITIDETNLCK